MGATCENVLIHTPNDLEHMRGVVRALLGAVGVLALLGVPYPLQMLPLLFLERTWKTIWILAIGLPRWLAGARTAATESTSFDCILGVVVCALAIPWGYVLRNYVRRRADPWRPERSRTRERDGGRQGHRL